jgi:hypothetical protein
MRLKDRAVSAWRKAGAVSAAGLAVAAQLIFGDARAAEPAGHDGALCEAAARSAAAETGVPLDLLRAIMLVESGQVRGGRRQPWPWAVNVGGRGTWHPDAQAALRMIASVPAESAEHVDIGCFQLNRRWHGQHFVDAAAMLDPMANARHAARFLAMLHDEFGSWPAAAGAYHSRDPVRAAAYATRVAAYWPRPDAGTEANDLAAAPPAPSTGRGYPLLVAGEPSTGPSLFPSSARDSEPLAGATRPLIGGG